MMKPKDFYAKEEQMLSYIKMHGLEIRQYWESPIDDIHGVFDVETGKELNQFGSRYQQAVEWAYELAQERAGIK